MTGPSPAEAQRQANDQVVENRPWRRRRWVVPATLAGGAVCLLGSFAVGGYIGNQNRDQGQPSTSTPSESAPAQTATLEPSPSASATAPASATASETMAASATAPATETLAPPASATMRSSATATQFFDDETARDAQFDSRFNASADAAEIWSNLEHEAGLVESGVQPAEQFPAAENLRRLNMPRAISHNAPEFGTDGQVVDNARWSNVQPGIEASRQVWINEIQLIKGVSRQVAMNIVDYQLLPQHYSNIVWGVNDETGERVFRSAVSRLSHIEDDANSATTGDPLADRCYYTTDALEAGHAEAGSELFPAQFPGVNFIQFSSFDQQVMISGIAEREDEIPQLVQKDLGFEVMVLPFVEKDGRTRYYFTLLMNGEAGIRGEELYDELLLGTERAEARNMSALFVNALCGKGPNGEPIPTVKATTTAELPTGTPEVNTPTPTLPVTVEVSTTPTPTPTLTPDRPTNTPETPTATPTATATVRITPTHTPTASETPTLVVTVTPVPTNNPTVIPGPSPEATIAPTVAPELTAAIPTNTAGAPVPTVPPTAESSLSMLDQQDQNQEIYNMLRLCGLEDVELASILDLVDKAMKDAGFEMGENTCYSISYEPVLSTKKRRR